MILGLIDQAVENGARQEAACEVMGIDRGTARRWRAKGGGDDRRAGPKSAPKNKLSEAEEKRLLDVMNQPEYRDLSPRQIVPRLADAGEFIASESTAYRLLAKNDQLRHREASRPKQHQRPQQLIATRPNQVWSWDITYLKTSVRGVFFYLYLVMDVFSRKIVGVAVHDREAGQFAADLITSACAAEGVRRDQVALHQDNGAPMKHGTFKALLERLGVFASFSRPGVSDDNPFSESLFRTLKYSADFPSRPFETIDEAAAWVHRFQLAYNTEHRHSGIRYVTPDQRHNELDAALLANRHAVYEAARNRHPERWSGNTRDWSRIEEVVLNPATKQNDREIAA